VQDVLPKRFGKYGLTLHPEKTRLVRFTSPSRKSGEDDDDGSGSFDFLGFTHYWAQSSNGYLVVMLKTAKSRFGAAVRRIHEWCSRHRHHPVTDQCAALTRKLRGHFNYFGVVGNATALWRFSRVVHATWRSWLNRRSHRARMTCARMWVLHEAHPLPWPDATKMRSLRA
jgi:hypothetical protein